MNTMPVVRRKGREDDHPILPFVTVDTGREREREEREAYFVPSLPISSPSLSG